ncbi:MAG: cyclic nucleotide-binding domain-containing protein [Tabrizicola sp.]|uniref:cyclic nucleotide-binding domain-containing protein n=1 Tax=Tabrizicola sp. TaxID=2005166 RepID=UPI002737671F|nr:cyclic nucleotide-binding domain-containing protein [Tabrizicola sp.]MDP3264185.1 cyclic nucleotide-binding domain-containing protein [Tabrizicola sp.]MDZ4066087.1 cyclic nucleotide-binding domain-containing protein [Tabrizicola sp.]
MKPADLSEIQTLSLFRDMTQPSYERLTRGVYVQHFPAGLTMIRQGDPADFLHILLEGQVELFAGWGDRETTMAVIKPLGTFILAATIRDAPYLMSARTLERSRIMLLPSEDLRQVFQDDRGFANAIVDELAGCYRAVVRHAKGLKLRTSRERIASYLMRQARLAGDVRSYQLPMEKRLLASYLGMTAENLSRALRGLEQDGLKVDGTRVIITDPVRLMKIARLDPLMDGPDPSPTTEAASLPKASAWSPVAAAAPAVTDAVLRTSGEA